MAKRFAGLASMLLSVSMLAAAGDGAVSSVRGVQSPVLATIVEKYWAAERDRDPFIRMQAGLPVVSITPDSAASIAADVAAARRLLDELSAVSESTLSGEDRLTWRVLRWLLVNRAASADRRWYEFPITSYTLFDLQYAGQSLSSNAFESEADRSGYLSLLDAYAARLEASAERLKSQAARGIRLPRPALPGTRALLENLRAGTTAWVDRPASKKMAAFKRSANDQFLEGARRRVDRINAAFAALLALLGPDYEAAAPQSVGLAQYPGGETYYRMLVRLHTSMDLSPEEVMAYGLERMRNIDGQLEALATQLGIAGGRKGIRQFLRSQPRLIARSADEVAAHYRRHMSAIAPKLSQYFSHIPRAPYGVRRLDPRVEGGMTFGYYQPPTKSNPRGEYHFNGSALEERSLAFAAGIIFHEIAPGHHFHMASQLENESLPEFRRLDLSHNAFNEGWAEYAAGLAGEMGLLDDPVDRLGRLMLDAFLTARLVVDPGMNAFDWTLVRAKEFMLDHTYQSPTEIDSEVLRYSTAIPGQALGYKIGHRAFLEMRAQAEARCGKAFDIRAFHAVVLGHGAMPLAIVSEQVDQLCQTPRSDSATESKLGLAN